MRSRSVTALAAVCAVLVFAACSGDDPTDPVNAVTEEAEESEPRESVPTTCPLTGEDPESGVDIDRPAVAVKIEDAPDARPQSGLENADLVFEERVEGGITRFLVIYHCDDTDHAGPVRSGRFDDPKLAKPFTEVLAASGSNSIVEKEMNRRDMIYRDENSTSALFRDPPGVIQIHSLFANTKKLRKIAVRKKVGPPTRDVFTFGPLAGDAKPARRVTINFTESNAIEYKWKGHLWRRFEAGLPFMAAAGDQIAIPNVLIQVVKVDNSDGLVDAAGNPSPELTLVNASGKLFLFREGKVIKGRWRMRDVGDPPVYETLDGKPMVFATGPIWVELVPSKKGEIKGDFSFK
jgi:hypothetical protein